MAAFYTLLYIAEPTDAEEIGCAEDAAERWPSMWLKHIGDTELVQLWALLGDLPVGSERTLMGELLYQGGDEGPFVMRVPAEFVTILSRLPKTRVAEIAAAWRGNEELAHWPLAGLAAVVDELREFAGRAITADQSVLQVANL